MTLGLIFYAAYFYSENDIRFDFLFWFGSRSIYTTCRVMMGFGLKPPTHTPHTPRAGGLCPRAATLPRPDQDWGWDSEYDCDLTMILIRLVCVCFCFRFGLSLGVDLELSLDRVLHPHSDLDVG